MLAGKPDDGDDDDNEGVGSDDLDGSGAVVATGSPKAKRVRTAGVDLILSPGSPSHPGSPVV